MRWLFNMDAGCHTSTLYLMQTFLGLLIAFTLTASHSLRGRFEATLCCMFSTTAPITGM